MTKSAIRIQRLCKNYGKTTALSNLSLDVPKGSIFGILGPNGAGKTTLISILTTLMRPTSGRVNVMGYDLVKNPNKIRMNIGVVFQDSPVDNSLTPEAILDIQLRLHKIKENRRQIIEKCLRLTGLFEVKNRETGTFSGGMKRKVEVARGIVHSPKLLFLDEPTAGLDPKTRLDLWMHFLMLNKKYKSTLFIATNHLEEAEYLCTNICIIDNGKLIVNAPKTELIDSTEKTDIIRIKTSADLNALKVLKEYNPFVKNDEIHITTSESAKSIERILNLLTAEGITLLNIGIDKPDLQEIFLRLTKHE